MDNSESLAVLQGQLSIDNAALSALQQKIAAETAAIAVLTTGYQSDSAAMAKGISDGITSALAPIQAAITAAQA